MLDDNRNQIVTGWQSNGGPNQRWKVQSHKDSAIIVTIQNEDTGNFLRRTGVGAESYSWTLHTDDSGDTSVQIDIFFPSLALDLAGPNNGDSVKANDKSSSASQTWWFVAV